MITGLNVFAYGAANGDCDVTDAFFDLWANTEIGLGGDGDLIGTSYQTGAAWGPSFPFGGSPLGEWEQFIGAAGLWFSPLLDRQQPASKWFQDLLDITQSEMIVTCEAIYVRPYCTTQVTGPTPNLLFGPYTYTPNLTPLKAATDDDYVVAAGAGPVQVDQTLPQDQFNEIKIEFVNRANSYNVEIVHVKLQDQVDVFTYRPGQVQRYHHITRQDVAMKMAAMQLYRSTLDVNRYQFKLNASWIWLDPMDIIAINDAGLGLVNYPVRVISVSEDADLNLDVVAGDVWTCAPDSFSTQPAISRSGQNAGQGAPSAVNAPVIFEPPEALTNGTLQVWLAVGDPDANYGGCGVWVSYDGGVSFTRLGPTSGSNPAGILTSALAAHAAGLDTTNTLSVDVAGALSSISAAAAAALNNLCYAGGELLSFETATATGVGRYNLTTLYRGAYGTASGAHGVGAPFAYLNVAGRGAPGLFILTIAPSNVGATLYFKFTPFNLEGQQEADVSDVEGYPYTVTGAGLATTTLAFSYTGAPTSSERSNSVTISTPLTLPAGLSGSVATAGVAATATTTFDIQVNGITKGTLSFAASATAGTFTFASAVALSAGDVVSLVAPASPDATLANIGVTLQAT